MFPNSIRSLNDQERHDYILKTFILNQKICAEQRKHKRDIDVIREHHRFLWDDDDEDNGDDTWEVRLARRYYDKLFKEYCIADLTRHKENKIALRWRTEPEVVAGTGQFACGSRKCTEKNNLRSWEVNFAYKEQGEPKNALVKLRLCPEHSAQLNYSSKKREIKRLKRTERQDAKKKKRLSSTSKKTPQSSDVTEDENIVSASRSNSTAVESSSVVNERNDDTACEADDNLVGDSEGIWNQKPDVEMECTTRESEFERYLEDLLL